MDDDITDEIELQIHDDDELELKLDGLLENDEVELQKYVTKLERCQQLDELLQPNENIQFTHLHLLEHLQLINFLPLTT